MNSFSMLKIFAVSLCVAVVVGPITQRLLPGWSTLVVDVGAGGAWFISIMYHIVYGIIIGTGTVLGAALLAKTGTPATLRGTALATGVMVVLFDLGFVLLALKAGDFALLALCLLGLGAIGQLLVSYMGIGRSGQGGHSVSE
ncbi:hypothetical protein [Sedimenticola sp.]|uniref:hypothetical protein n=1 Tax=Sedimenticola sp. TaxID=1940285 RepID=UPI003D09BF5F